MDSIFTRNIKKYRNITFPLEDKFIIKSTIAANNNASMTLPIKLSNTDVDFLNIKLQYKNNNIYKNADLFATCTINGSTVTITNNDTNTHEFRVSLY